MNLKAVSIAKNSPNLSDPSVRPEGSAGGWPQAPLYKVINPLVGTCYIRRHEMRESQSHEIALQAGLRCHPLWEAVEEATYCAVFVNSFARLA